MESTHSTAWRELEALERRGVRANPYRAGRSLVMSRHGIVASSHVLATLAGLDALRSGGRAMDAAVASAAVLTVVEPMMTGIGGDAFFLYYDARTRTIHGLNGSGRSPARLLRDAPAFHGKPAIDSDSWEAVTVPGAVDAWTAGLDRFGSKPLSEVLSPAIRYAEEGFPVTEVVAGLWKRFEGDLRKDLWARSTYLTEGRAPAPASVFRNPNLARSLRQIASGGRDAFYRGPIADELTRYASESGGYLTREDLESHRSEWVEPISVDYRGFRVHQIPPNGQGIGVLMMLNILQGFDLSSMDRNSAEYLHLLIEAKKLAYADLYEYAADPHWSAVPVPELLSKDYAASRRKSISLEKAASSADAGFPRDGDTVYLTAVDREGNAVSFINSIFRAFGAKIVGGNTGILLQNRGSGFSLRSGHPNEYAPDKRPFHTIIPGMVTREGRLYLSYGLMGGAMQPQGHVQFLSNHLDFGMKIQEAAEAPRFNHTEGIEVLLEHGTPRPVMTALQNRGHAVVPGGGELFGGAQAILIDPATGTFLGASDPRKDGAALGY